MKNFLENGDTVVVTAPEDVSSGEFIKVGELYGVAPVAAVSGDPVVLDRKSGVYRLPKVTGTAWVQGQKLFWDAGAKKFTHDSTKTPVKAVAFAAAADTAAEGQVLIGAGDNVKVVSGSGTLDGSNPTPVTTGLTVVTGGLASLKKSTAPGVATSNLTTSWSGSDGALNVYAWKVTATGDSTQVASTGTEDFSWVAWGY